MIRAASLSIDVNLLSLSQLLQRQGVPHRIVEESGQQVIWVEGEGEAALVRQALADWSSNYSLTINSSIARSRTDSSWRRLQDLRPTRFPPAVPSCILT